MKEDYNMNKKKILKLVLDLQKHLCKNCKEVDYEVCSDCIIHIKLNEIIEECNGE